MGEKFPPPHTPHHLVEIRLTPKGPNYVLGQHSNFGQVPMNGILIFFF